MDLKWEEFERVQIRVGTITEAVLAKKAIKPAYRLSIDFGQQIGVRRSSAQITGRYQPETLIGKQVVAVVNFPVKQIGNFMSECLVLGSVGKEGDVVLLVPDMPVDNGLPVG